jgi:hypothetical protein
MCPSTSNATSSLDLGNGTKTPVWLQRLPPFFASGYDPVT